MILNIVMLVLIILIVTFIVLYTKGKTKRILDKTQDFPICKFEISDPEYIIKEDVKIAKFKVRTESTNKFYLDFPIGFKFYSNDKFISTIKIGYNVTNDNDEEIIYDNKVEFDEILKYYIYYINDIIIGSVDINIAVYCNETHPKIVFEILQNNLCYLDKEYKKDIVF